MQKETQKPNFEFIALMAALMSIVALAIDALLPAISNIGVDINSLDSTDNQLLVTMIFLGLGLGQLFFGPLSDCYGRKPVVYAGFILFLLARKFIASDNYVIIDNLGDFIILERDITDQICSVLWNDIAPQEKLN